MTGWCLLYGAVPLTLVEAINLVQSRSFFRRSSIAQYAAVEALPGVGGHLRQFARVPQGRALVVTKLKQRKDHRLTCRILRFFFLRR
ncbi:aspartate aminotransferase [Bradyrhizobium shewense]|uniref:Aspartate aminotransferase n=1 Tax=Bradyrhizobium shewense TaxID=1761772 RepID=A0A1C3XTL3_9BRAD|nr:aspartate aminotransferase [Bradyrhizobium shewense]